MSLKAVHHQHKNQDILFLKCDDAGTTKSVQQRKSCTVGPTSPSTVTHTVFEGHANFL
jgi:hypothetical protein